MSRLLLFLSKLIEDSEVPTPESAGEWAEQSWDVLENIASSLATSAASKKTKRISAIPTIWAQPLLMEMAIHEERHPLREEMIAQWEGMLAAIALKELWDLPLQVKSFNLDDESDESFVNSLRKLIPSDVHSLYQLRGRKNPWKEISVFLWDGNAVGMSSPSTLVCPAKAGQWENLPWFSEKDEKLLSPTEDLDWLTEEEAGQLWSWLDQLKQNFNELGNRRGSSQAINVILNLVGDYQRRLEVRQEQTFIVELVSGSSPLGDLIRLGGIDILNQPIKQSSQPSSVRLCPHKTPPVFIVPNSPELLTSREAQPIEEQWLDENQQQVKPQQIRIHDEDNVHLGNLNRKQLPLLASKWKLEWIGEGKQPKLSSPQGKLVDASKLFLDDFYFIPQEGVLPGGLLPLGSDRLTYEDGKKLTPLLPINPLLLDYLTPEALQESIEFEALAGGKQIQVKLRLPLSGVDRYEPKEYIIQKDYPVKKDNALEVPFLELWPNFQADGWQEYYLFYWNRNQKERAFEIRLPSQVNKTSVQFPQDKSLPSRYQISQLDKFPRSLTCHDNSGKLLGLILLPEPPLAGRDEPANWIVGLDFGTSSTNVMFEQKTIDNNGRIPEKLSFVPLNLKITQITQTSSGTIGEVRSRLLREYFPFDILTFPLASILTTRGSNKEDKDKSQRVLDGRIYQPDIFSFPIMDPYYHPSLKWSPEFPNFPIMFLEHLAVTLSAQAVRKNVRNITWCISYPSAFSASNQENYKVTWEDIIQKLNTVTGIKHSFTQTQENQLSYLTESSAVAQFFADHSREYSLTNTVFIDIGGGTSDISIWENWHPVYQCSLKIAGHDLFTQFLRQHLDVLDLLFDQVDLNQTEFSQEKRGDLGNLPEAKVDSLLDILMSVLGEKSLNEKRKMVQSNDDKKKVATFQKIIQLSELSIAGLYYYVGLLLRYLHGEPAKYKRDKLPDVYLAGNGSRILNWLSDQGKYLPDSATDKILRQVLINSSELNQGLGQTVLSRRPKDEVVFGLVSAQKQHPLPGLKQEENYYLAGEVCSLGKQNLNWDSKLELTSEIGSCEVPNLEVLPEFLLGFYLAWKEHKKDKKLLILDKHEYKPSAEVGDNQHIWDKVGQNMQNELQRIMIHKSPESIQFEPPFILGLKALLKVLSK